MKTRVFIGISVLAAVLPVHAQQAPNPLIRPAMSLSAPGQQTAESSNFKAGQPAREGGEAVVSRPRFDGWYVVFASDQTAILRAPDQAAGSDAGATKPGSPGFGAGAPEGAGARTPPTAAMQTLEVENGEIFTLAEAVLRAEIRNGRVTITYFGNANARRGVDHPEIVFSGRVTSNPIVQSRTMERPDDRYINSVKPAPSSVRSVLNGPAGGSGVLSTGGMSGTPAASYGGTSPGAN